MATRATIIYHSEEDGKFYGAYSHGDGYIEGLGQTLYHHYNTYNKAKKLVQGGHMSYPGDSYTSQGESYEDNKPESAKTLRGLFRKPIIGQEYDYLWARPIGQGYEGRLSRGKDPLKTMGVGVGKAQWFVKNWNESKWVNLSSHFGKKEFYLDTKALSESLNESATGMPESVGILDSDYLYGYYIEHNLDIDHFNPDDHGPGNDVEPGNYEINDWNQEWVLLDGENSAWVVDRMEFEDFLEESGEYEEIEAYRTNESIHGEWICPSMEELDTIAEDSFGEFGFETLSEDQMEDVLGEDGMEYLSQMAHEHFGEFGFATLNREEMEQIVSLCRKNLHEGHSSVGIGAGGRGGVGHGSMKTPQSEKAYANEKQKEEEDEAKNEKLQETLSEYIERTSVNETVINPYDKLGVLLAKEYGVDLAWEADEDGVTVKQKKDLTKLKNYKK